MLTLTSCQNIKFQARLFATMQRARVSSRKTGEARLAMLNSKGVFTLFVTHKRGVGAGFTFQHTGTGLVCDLQDVTPTIIKALRG